MVLPTAVPVEALVVDYGVRVGRHVLCEDHCLSEQPSLVVDVPHADSAEVRVVLLLGDRVQVFENGVDVRDVLVLNDIELIDNGNFNRG